MNSEESKKSQFWKFFLQYCEDTTIHGFKYIGKKSRIERIFWFIVICLSICGFSSLTLKIWNKWESNPVIVSFDDKSTPIWKIAFPAVTICSETKFVDKYYGNISKSIFKYIFFKKVPEADIPIFDTIIQICDNFIDSDLPSKLPEFSNVTDFSKTILKFAPTLMDTFFNCEWRQNKINCEKLFLTFLTDEGICFTFNTPESEEIYRNGTILDKFLQERNPKKFQWDLDRGFVNKYYSQNNSFPYRVSSPGKQSGLKVELQSRSIKNSTICKLREEGWKIMLHIPGEIPQTLKRSFQISIKDNLLVYVKPRVITTSEDLKQYDPFRRQCYFQDEKYLQFFKIYTQTNCEIECLTNFTLKSCGCVKFSMPRNQSIPICGGNLMECYRKAEIELSEDYSQELSCKCLPSCTTISYDIETSQTKYYKYPNYLVKEKDFLNKTIFSPIDVSSLHISFKEKDFIALRRSELYGFSDFFANIGGLFGLFLGVSAISIIEFIYFFTIRIYSYIKSEKLLL